MKNNTLLRIGIGLSLLLVLPAVLFGQNHRGDRADREIIENLERLRFSEEEIEAINEVQNRFVESRRIPTAELEVLRAQISREMVEQNPDLEEIEDLIRQGIEFEIQLRMAEIRRGIELQEILGQRRWAQMKQFGRGLGERGMDMRLLDDRIRAARPELLPTLRFIYQHAD